MPGIVAGSLCLLDDLGEVLPLGVSQQPLLVASKLELLAVNLLGVVFEIIPVHTSWLIRHKPLQYFARLHHW